MKKYKIERTEDQKNIADLNREKLYNKIVISIAGIGVITSVGIVFAYANKPEARYVGSMSHVHYEQKQEKTTGVSIIDFENYDLATIEKFSENVSSLYDDVDAIKSREAYEQIVSEKAAKWGIDANLAMALLTQESRGSNTSNVMQIRFNVWAGESFRVYDFENQKYVDILLTNDSKLYNSDKYLTINSKDLENPSTNISIGLAMLQHSMRSMNYNIPAGVQCYNYGPTTMNNKVFNKNEEQTFQVRDEVLKDQLNFSFMNYTDAYELGDNEYFYNVSRFLSPNEGTIIIKEYNPKSDTYSYHTFNYFKLLREYKMYKEEYLEDKNNTL